MKAWRIGLAGAAVGLQSVAGMGQGMPAKAKVAAPHVVTHAAGRAAGLTPLSARERVVQLLDRFTFGPEPGEVDRVMAEGEDKWVDEQLTPEAIPDEALRKRLGGYPTLAMTPQQASLVYPDRAQVDLVVQGKVPYPGDPLLKSVYEVEAAKLEKEVATRKMAAAAAGSGDGKAVPTEAEKAAQKKAEQDASKEIAARVAGELFALPKGQRMAALEKMPVEDRIAFTGNGNLSGDQRTLLLADFTPREREAFLAMAGQVSSSYNTGGELEEARMLRDILSERQLQAVMTNFWFNHFNVYVPKDSDQWYTTSYERDVIEKHALGSFRDLLLATAQSPAMMVYLDNWLSIGPDSVANGVDPRNPKARRGNKGLNENYGREVMELHTVGVNGGYTQADVTALSAILTGWGVEKPDEGGGFVFDPKRHEPGPKVWMGYLIQEDGTYTKLPAGVKRTGPTFGPGVTAEPLEVATAESEKQGITALNLLAASPQTARFISTLLAQYFVADKPPAALVERLQKVYLASGGEIKAMLRALIASPEFNSRQYYRNKVKTPEEFVASAFRVTGTDPQNLNALAGTLKTMGMEMYHALPPTGYYLTADQWMNSVALVDRLNFAYALTMGKVANQRFDAPKLLAMGLLGAPVPGGATGGTGAELAMKVLEATVIGAPVSAKTNRLIEKQVQGEPKTASAGDTLNLLAALVVGAPEFQVR